MCPVKPQKCIGSDFQITSFPSAMSLALAVYGIDGRLAMKLAQCKANEPPPPSPVLPFQSKGFLSLAWGFLQLPKMQKCLNEVVHQQPFLSPRNVYVSQLLSQEQILILIEENQN